MKRTGGYAYLQIAESFREGGRVRQRVLSTLGRLDLLQSTGQLDATGARFCQRLAILDAHAAGQTEPVAVRRIGPDLIFARLWEELGIGAVLRQHLEARRSGAFARRTSQSRLELPLQRPVPAGERCMSAISPCTGTYPRRRRRLSASLRLCTWSFS